MSPLDLPASYKLAAGIVAGMILGFVLVKSDFSNSSSVKEAVQLRNGRVIKTLLLWLGLGSILFFIARRMGMADIHVRSSYIWGAVFGGIFCGTGLVACGMTPLTAISSFASGKFYALWTLAGMLLAYPLVSGVSSLLSKTVYLKSMAVDEPATPYRFFDMSNPALYVTVIMLILLLAVHFTIGDSEE